MKINKLTIPEFLLAEFPIKTGGNFMYNRQFIVHRGISLIEVILNDIVIELLNDNVVSKRYSYKNDTGFVEKYTLAFHTNNAHFYNLTPEELLDKAWQFYEEYLRW